MAQTIERMNPPAPKTGTDAANGQVTAAPRPKRARAASTKPL